MREQTQCNQSLFKANDYYDFTLKELADLTGKSRRSIYDWAVKATQTEHVLGMGKATSLFVRASIWQKLDIDDACFSLPESAAILEAGQMHRLADLIFTRL